MSPNTESVKKQQKKQNPLNMIFSIRGPSGPLRKLYHTETAKKEKIPRYTETVTDFVVSPVSAIW